MDKMLKARIALILEHPFFGSLALRLTLNEDPSCQTAYTDGVVLGFNAQFTGSLTLNERVGLIAHEVMHVALCHHLRRGDRNPKVWNIAGDFAINDILLESGFVLPEGALTGMGTHRSADAIYQSLPETILKNDNLPDFGEVRDLPGKDGKNPTSAQMNQALQEIKIRVAQAATQAKAMGKFPASLDRWMDEMTRPQVDWREVLRRFMGRVSSDDYAWTPPNRRLIHQGLYLPSMRSNGISQGVVAVDTSGSVSDQEIAQFSTEISAILEAADASLTVIYCDRAVQRVERFDRYDLPVKIHPIGGGGTDFRPPFKWVEDHGLSPGSLIYLTDLACHRFPAAPDYPVLWARMGHFGVTPPFGDVLEIKD